MSSQPTRKAYAFNVVVPGGQVLKTFVDATASIVSLGEVYCVQHFGGRNYQVTVKREPAMAKIVDADSLVIGEERVAVMFLPSRVSSDTRAQALSPYCKAIHISRGLMGSCPAVTTGTRYVPIETTPGTPVPNSLKEADHGVTCDYKGMQRCTAPFCAMCGSYGHVGKGCVLPCRRCGDPHETAACSLRCTYLEAVYTLQSSTHAPDYPSNSPATLASTQEDLVQVPPAGTPAASPASPEPDDHEGVLPAETPCPVDIPGEPFVELPASREPTEHNVPEAEVSPCLPVDSCQLVINEKPGHEDDVVSRVQRVYHLSVRFLAKDRGGHYSKRLE
ncbi:hypothetical protein HPB49_019859 [Dermacentor silvarum]|uniref:Uncharacterized protein n=1 Tax=Dermacentor silvarum TaxID=543639 RepID=A0ACB8CH78_DERSI|nr:hypothetical protein HPB49_019859 [Dermacentor silvarum]